MPKSLPVYFLLLSLHPSRLLFFKIKLVMIPLLKVSKLSLILNSRIDQIVV